MSVIDEAPEEPDQLRDQLRRLLRHRVLIVLGVLLGTLAGGALSVAGGAEWTATGEVVVQPIGADPFAGGEAAADRQLSMGTEQQLARSATVAGRAAEALGGMTEPDALRRELRVANPPETRILRFEYTADSPQRAARGVNAFVQAYLDHRQDSAAHRIATAVAGLEGELQPLLTRREKLVRRIAEAPAGPAREADEPERDALGTQIAELRGAISGLKSLDTTPGEVVRRGEPPTAPSGPGTALLLIAGAVLGLAGGVGAAWVRSLLDPRVRSAGEVRELLGAPVLGVLPRRRGGTGLLEVGLLRGGARAEAWRAIAFRVRHAQGTTGSGSLLVASPRGHAHTASAAVNLAGALAETGADVLLVDADLRASRPAGTLPLRGGGPSGGGPLGGRTGDGALGGRLRRDSLHGEPGGKPGGGWPGEERVPVDADFAGRLDLLPGRSVAQPVRALSSPEFTRLLTEPGGPYGHRVVLTGPLLTHADGTAVARHAGGVLVVCDPDRTRRDDLERIRELITAVGGQPLGAVLDRDTGRRRPARLARTFASTAKSTVKSTAKSAIKATAFRPGRRRTDNRNSTETGTGTGTGVAADRDTTDQSTIDPSTIDPSTIDRGTAEPPAAERQDAATQDTDAPVQRADAPAQDAASGDAVPRGAHTDDGPTLRA